MKVAFLDRDGVINKEVSYLHKIKDFIYTEKCLKGLKVLRKLGYEIVIVTNQAGLAKGIFSEKEFDILSSWLLEDLKRNSIEVLDYLFCPHHPDGKVKKYTMECAHRKPNPGMLVFAQKKYKINMKSSILIGDKLSDVKAAKSAGVGNFYLVESGHALSPQDSLYAPVFPNLFEVAKSLCQ